MCFIANFFLINKTIHSSVKNKNINYINALVTKPLLRIGLTKQTIFYILMFL